MLNRDICNVFQLPCSWLQPVGVTGNQYKVALATVALFYLNIKFSDLPPKENYSTKFPTLNEYVTIVLVVITRVIFFKQQGICQAICFICTL